MAKMRKQTKATKMKLSERVQRRPEEEQVAPGIAETAEQVEVTQPVKSSTAAAKASVERDNSSVAIKLMEASTDAQEDAIEVDKKLLKAVSELTKTMQFGYKRAQEEKKKGLAGYVQGKIQNVKKAFSLEGVAGMAGIQRDSGTLAGAVLGSVLERKEKKAKKAEYIAQFGEFTEQGRKLAEGKGGDKRVAAEGARRYKEISEAEPIIAELEEKKKNAEKFNGTLSVEDTAALAAAKEKKKQATDYSLVQKPIGGEKKEDLLAGVAEGVKSEIAVLSPEEKQSLNAADPEFLKGVFEGALGGLTDVNEKQLDQLVALVRASTMSEEDKLESKNKDNMLTSIQDPKEEKKKEEEGGGWMKSIMGMFGNFGGLIKGLPGMLMGSLSALFMKFLGPLAKIAGPIINAGKTIVGGAIKAIPAIAGAGAKVAGVASKVLPAVTGIGTAAAGLASKALPAVAEVGTKAAGLGTKALGGLSKLGGFAKGALGKLGPVAMAGMAAYDAVSGFNEAGANLGIEGREATLGEKLSSAAGSAASGFTFGMLGKDTASKGIASFFGAGPSAEKTATPNRVSQSGMLAAATDDLQMMGEKKEAAAPTVVNSAPTTIINQGGGKAAAPPRTPIRNPEISYNHRLTRYFVG